MIHYDINCVFIVGFGSIGKRHLQIIKTVLPKCDVYVVHHDKPESKLGVMEKPLVKGVYYSYEDAIDNMNDVRPELVFICNPSPFHLQTAFRFSKCNSVKGIFIEKPVSNRLKGIQRFFRWCKEHNVIVQVGYQLRFSDTLQELQNVIRNGGLGDLCSVQVNFGEYLPGWRKSSDYSKDVTANKHLGGGVLLEISHELDYLCWLFGKVESVIGYASKQSDLKIDVEDTVDLLIKFKDLSANVNVHIDMLDRLPHRTLRVVGTHGTAVWESGDSVTSSYTLKIKYTDVETFTVDRTRNEIMISQLRHFLACVRDGIDPEIDGRQAVKIIEVAKLRNKLM